MKLLSNMSIFKKLVTSFIIVAIFTCIVGIVSISKMKTVKNNLQNIYNVDLNQTNALLEIKINFLEVQTDMLTIMNKENRAELNDIVTNVNAQVDQNNELISSYSSRLVTNESKSLFNELKQYRQNWSNSRESYILLIQKGNYPAAQKEFENCEKYRNQVFSTIGKIINLNYKSAQNDYNTSISKYNFSLKFSIILIIISLIISIGLGIIMSKHVSNPLLKIKGFANRLAKFDFSKDIVITRTDEFGQVGSALNTAQKNISR